MHRDQSIPDDLRDLLEQQIRLEFGDSLRISDVEGLVPYVARIRAQAGRLRALANSDDPSDTFYAVERNVGHVL